MTTQVEQTLNVTVAQIEDALLAGQTIPDFSREWSEPPANVLAVFRRLQREGKIPTNGPAQVATTSPGPRPLASVPMEPTTGTGPVLSVDALVNAAERSESKRTQALGVKLADLIGVVRARLAEERDAAVKAEQNRRERELAAAEVERLESALADARAKLRTPGKKRIVTDAGRALMRENIAKAQRAASVESPCRKGCGFVAKSTAGRAGHERHCGAS